MTSADNGDVSESLPVKGRGERHSLPEEESDEAIRTLLRQLVVEVCDLTPEELDDERPLAEYGLQSRDAVGISGQLETALNRSLPATLLWENPTIDQLVRRLTAEGSEAKACESVFPDQAAEAPETPADGADLIAVVGAGCRLPGGISGPDEFWYSLLGERDMIGQVPPDRWQDFDDGSAGTAALLASTTHWGGFLEDIYGFDADYFGIAPREAELMDPQQRLLLEVTWEALEHARIAPPAVRGTETGVFVGLSSLDYSHLTTADLTRVTAYTSTGAAGSIAANRLSYQLDVHGPSMTIDTACSSSLVAVHMACRSLRSGESTMALAAGVNLLLSPMVTANFDLAGALSPDGRCKPFSARADGIARGEGCGVVVLKRLADARNDGDRILAVIRGTSVNSDGRSAGLMAPNPVAQGALLRAALQDAQVDAVEIDYVETHGTGTFLGDPIEAVALGTVMGRGRDADLPLLIGSVKSNLGHLEGAAGIVGLIKTVLSLHHGWIPASLHFDTPNPHIDFAASHLRVVTEATRWPAGRDRSPLAGVSAFGFGGTNAHAILEQAPPGELVEAPGCRSAEEAAADEARPSVLFVSARSVARVSDTAAGLAEWLDTTDGRAASLDDVAHSLAHHVRGPATAAVVARGRDRLAAGLLALAQDQSLRGVVPAQQHDGRSRENGPVFVFSGYGSQWEGMGRGLLDEDTAFAAAVEALGPLFVSLAGSSLADLIRGAQANTGVERTQSLLYGIQVALARTWQAYGIEPSAVIGHSMGEVSAAVVAGALDADDGLRVILRRSSLLAEIDGTGAGAMAAVELSEDVRPAVLARYPGVEIAVHASPQRCTLTGPSEAVTRLVEELDAAGNSANLLNVGGAGHSPTIDPVLPALRASLAELSPRSATVPWYGTVADDPRAPVHADATYWCSNARQSVRLQQAVAAAAEDGHRTFLEISPHPIAEVPVRETLEADVPDAVRVLATLRRQGDEVVDLRTSMAALQLAGFNVRTDVVRPPGRRITLPSPPWRRVHHWINMPEQAGRLPQGGHPLLGLRIDVPGTDRILWQGDVGTAGWNRTARHIHGTPVLTLSVCADMMLSAVLDAAVTPLRRDIALTALTMHEWLPLASSTPVTTSWEPLAGGGATVELHTRSAAGTWLCHASATVPSPDVVPSHPAAQLPAEAGVLASAHHSNADGPNVSGRALPSGVLDVCLHAPTAPQADFPGAVGDSDADEQPQSDSGAVPVSVASLRVALGSDSSSSALPVLCGPRRLDAPEPGGRAPEALWDVRVGSMDGHPVVEAQGILMSFPDPGELPQPLEEMTYEVLWVKVPIAALPEGVPAHWLLMTVGPEETAGPANRYVPSLSSDLQGRGHQVRVSRYDRQTTDALLTGWYEEVGSDPAAVVILLTDTDTSGSGCWAVSAAADVARHLAAASGHAAQPRLWLLTDGALSVTPGETGDPDRAALQGLVRVMALEQPQLRATLVDIGRVPDSSEKLVEELLANGEDDQVAWRGDTRLAARLVPADLSDHPMRTRMARQDGSYIITGGLGGLGLATAHRLAQLGAGHVVLNGRRSPSAKTQSVLKQLRELGTAVTVVQGDISEPHVADRLVEAALALGHSLRGVAHAAGVLHDGVISQVGPGDIETVFRPKVTGARHLESATEGHSLDWWLAFSSAAAMLGSPGQSAYAAANAWLDGQASQRQARGLPATSIAWGPWVGAGAAPEISAMGLEPVTASEGLDALQLVLTRGPVHTGVVRLDPRKLTDSFPGLEGIPYYSRLPLPDGPGDEWIGLKDLGSLDDAQAAAVVSQRVSLQVAAVMGHVPEAIDATMPLTELGLDSLMAVRIRNALKRDFAIVLPQSLLLRGASLTDLVDTLLKSLERSGPAVPNALATTPEPEAEELTLARKPRDLPLPTTLDPRDPSERLVAGVWESVLGCKPAGVHQELASEQGDSGTAESLAAGIRERLGDKMPGVDLGQITGHSTVAAIADLIRPVVNGDSQSSVRVLREPVGRTSRHPLFVFHPAGGPTSVYRPLVQLLPAEQSVYGFDRIDTITTMEEKATHYLCLMRDIQPAGPYRLLGWSFGGCLAYEVACQLQNRGEQAEFVGLIDTILPAALPGIDSKDIIIERFGRFAEYIQNTYGGSLPLSHEDLADVPEEKHIDVVMGMVAEAGLDMPPGIMEHQRTSYIDARVGERYRPQPYRGKVVLYRAQEAHQLTTTLDPRYLRDETDLGWEPLCSGLTVVPIPGDHLSMIDPPHVSDIAQHLARALSSAQ